MKDKLGDKARLEHIIDSITEIESYIQNFYFGTFRNNSMSKYASIKQLETQLTIS